MDIKIIFAVTAIIIGLPASFYYIKDIFALKTKPHIYTWLIWSLTTVTAAAGVYYGGGGIGLINFALMALITFSIFLISLKYGTKNINMWDTTILMAALIAILVWWQLHQPLLSIFMVSGIDVVGYIPSFRKTWQEPWSETMITWLYFAISNTFVILALNQYNLLTMTYLVAIISANLTLFLICLVRRPFIAKPI